MGLANFFCKEPNGKYFRFCGSYKISITVFFSLYITLWICKSHFYLESHTKISRGPSWHIYGPQFSGFRFKHAGKSVWIYLHIYSFFSSFLLTLPCFPSGTIFLLVSWVCLSTDFWPLQCLMIRWPLIIMLVSCMWKVVLLLLFLSFFSLGFRALPRHIDYYSWYVLVEFSVFFLPKVFFLQLLYLWLNIFHQMWEDFSYYFFKSFSASFSLCFFWDSLPVCLYAWQYSQISEALFIFLQSFFLCVFQKWTFYWSVFTFTDSFFLPSHVCCWVHLVSPSAMVLFHAGISI